MKKKILITLAALIILNQCGFAKTDRFLTFKTDNQAFISVKEEESQQKTDLKTPDSAEKGEILPTLDNFETILNNADKKNSQIDSAKSISERINDSLKNNALKIDEKTVTQIVNVDDCVKIALANHPSIQYYKSSAEIYKSKIAQAWSAYFPTIGAGVEYTRNNMLITIFEVSQQKYNLFYMPTLSANMLLFDFGKTKTKADIAKKTYLATEENVKMSINDVIYGVKKAYYALLFAKQREQVYEDSVKDYEMHLEQANAFYRVGTKAKIDVLTAEYNLGKAKLNLIKSQNGTKLAYANVNNAIGIPEFQNYAITENLETRSYEIDCDEMLERAFKTRPEYLAAKKKAEASALLIKGSKRAFLPDLSIFGSFQSGGTKPARDIGYQFGGRLAYSNFNVLLLKKQLDESKATAKRDLAELENTRQKVYLEVKQAYIDFQNAKDSIPVSALAMVQAKEQYNLASGRYKVGLGDAVELKDAENTYRNAQLEYYSNLMNYNIAEANLERVTGTPIKPSENEDKI